MKTKLRKSNLQPSSNGVEGKSFASAETMTNSYEPNASRPPKDELFERQVASYASWLAAQTRQHKSRVHHEMSEYAVRAMRAVEVGKSRIQTFAPFRYKYSALQTITPKQVVFLSIIALVWVSAMVWNWKLTLVWTISLITIGYMTHLILDVMLALQIIRSPSEEHIDETIINALENADWPPYTILCPLYKEAQVVPQFVKAMQAIDYPPDKLQILFLTEEDDVETRRAILSLGLPEHFTVITVPDGAPRTKPRACNYGLVEATGQYIVIYDAEDVPDPLQLKKAVLTFANHGPDLACVQAKLNFYNPQQNLLTRWFTAEYSLWFDLILPGMQKTKLAIPLGGTSNHFPAQTLRALGGWDAFNVTEDCDLGLRLSWFRLKTVVVDSTTFEEANSLIKNWIRQRSRWIKGYMQTYLVHMREPLHYLSYRRFRELFSLQVVIGGKTAILLINPFMWLLLTLTIIFHEQVTRVFATLFPIYILYIGVITLFLGNFFYGYIYLLGCMKREQFRLVKWMLLIPVYWFLASMAACMALYELFTRPHYWQKTIHGLHLKTKLPASNDTMLQDSTGEDLKSNGQAQSRKGVIHHALPNDAHTNSVRTKKEGRAQSNGKANSTNGLERIWPNGHKIENASQGELRGTTFADQVQKNEALRHYAKLELVPVPSVQDSVESMIAPRKPALLSSQLASLEQSKRAKRDSWFTVTLFTAMALSIAACLYFFKQNQLMLFHDAVEQMNIVRGLVVGPPQLDFPQLGGTELPLPRLSIALFIWNDGLWRTGLAGSIPSMVCFIVTAVYVFLSARLLTRNSSISYLSSLLFMLTPTILYLQSTSVSELMGIATLTMTCYYLLAWTQSNKLSHLLGTAGSVCLATLCRYDAWIFLVVLFVFILIVGLVKHQKREQIASNLLVFSMLGGLGIAMWIAWCWVIFGDPIYFVHALFLSKTALRPFTSPHTVFTYQRAWQLLYLYALVALETLGTVLASLSLLAIAVFLLRWGLKPTLFPALAILALIALHCAALYIGQSMLVLPFPTSLNFQDHVFSASLGAELVAPAAIFIATLVEFMVSLIALVFKKR